MKSENRSALIIGWIILIASIIVGLYLGIWECLIVSICDGINMGWNLWELIKIFIGTPIVVGVSCVAGLFGYVLIICHEFV